MLGVGQGVSILVANSVGESKFETAQKEAYYSLIITVIVNFVLGAVLFICSDLIVSLYSGVGLQAREIASYLIKFDGIYLIVSGINLTLFFLLRAGGKTEIVFLFDSCFCWLISIPFAIVLVNFTNMDFKTLYVLVYSVEIIKAIVGMVLLLSKKWYKNLVVDSNIESVN
jgi:Na+-driven multidrug efflux pump